MATSISDRNFSFQFLKSGNELQETISNNDLNASPY